MSRSTKTPLAASFLRTACLTAFATGQALSKERPHILLVMADDQGTDEPVFELYQRADDPMEKMDPSAEQPERVAAMKAALEGWQRSVLDRWAGKDYQPKSSP
jgi:hypothetical protein